MNDITEIFRTAKEHIDIRECAQRYGMTVDRHGRGLCPFHDDSHPSLSFKGKYFKCFACGEGGDVFKLVGRLTGIEKPVDVLKMLDREYGLSLPLGVKISRQEAEEISRAAEERRHYRELEERFREWSCHAFRVYSKYLRLLRQWRTEYKPCSPDEEINPLFTESLLKFAYIEYLTEKLTFADENYMREFYVNYRKEVDLIEHRITDYENRQGIS